MGCCQSREGAADGETPRPASDPSRSTAPTTTPAGAATTTSSRDVSRLPITNIPPPLHSPVRSGSSTIPSTTARPNLPITPPTPPATSPAKVSPVQPPWPRKHLARERDAFFDTRVTGHADVWRALRVVCDMIRADDVAGAQGILDALNMTCPTGKITRDRGGNRYRGADKGGLFDERGTLYELPTWVVVDPLDLVEESGEKDEDGMDDAASEEEEDDDEDGDEPRSPTRRGAEEKGKGRAEDLGDMVPFRARLSHTGTDVQLTVGTKEKVGEIVRRIRPQIAHRRVRLMYLGTTLDERATLDQTGWKQGHVVNAMVFEGDEGMLPTSK